MNNAVNLLPKMLFGKELYDAITVLPRYDRSIIYADKGTRLAALNDLYDIYLPNKMSEEIYTKIYLSMMRSLKKKQSLDAVRQAYSNHRTINKLGTTAISSGIDSFSIVSPSGIGKSSAIQKALNLIGGEITVETCGFVETVIPAVVVQCPFDASVKNLLLAILQRVDDLLGTVYYPDAVRGRSTTDQLVASVSQVAQSHICLLIIDEIQNLAKSKNGTYAATYLLTQLINTCNISVCMVGTMECMSFLQQEHHMARRSVGLKYDVLPYDEYFRELCNVLFSYQYVKNPTEIDDGIVSWLYEHSGGVTSAVVALIHDAQEIGILEDYEYLNLVTLNKAFNDRMEMMHEYIQAETSLPKTTASRRKRPALSMDAIQETADTSSTIAEWIKIANARGKNVHAYLKDYHLLEEVSI